MAEYPYAINPPNVRRFLTTMRSVGRPATADQRWLASIGFKDGAERGILKILRFLGFTEDDGTPTDRWRQFRNAAEGGAVMATALAEAYSELFSIYPDAYRKDDEALRNFFGSHTDVGHKAISYILRTFRVLVEFADFDQPALLSESANVTNGDETRNEVETGPDRPASIQPDRSVGVAEPAPKTGLVVNVNIQLQLPETENAAIYDKLFEAMKRHLLS
jgi:hypothetical protein